MTIESPHNDRMHVLAAEVLAELKRMELMAKAANMDPTKAQILTISAAMTSYCAEQFNLLRNDLERGKEFKQ